MAKMPRTRFGFGFHTSTKWKAARTFAVSVFALMVSCFVILSEPHPLNETLARHPAWFFSGLVFLLFSVALGVQFFRVMVKPFILEFTETEIVSYRYWRVRRIPFAAIEIFSPKPEDMFKHEPTVRELREQLGIEDFLSVSCRLRPGHFSEREGDFMFFEKVRSVPYELQAEMVNHLRSKIDHFELLVYDWGDDGDETNA